MTRNKMIKELNRLGIKFPTTWSDDALTLLLKGDVDYLRCAKQQVEEWEDLRDNGPILNSWDGKRMITTRVPRQ